MAAQIEVSLRPATDQDIAAFWAHQQANRPDADTPGQQEAFVARWHKILDNPNAPVRAIVASGRVVGYVAQFLRNDLPEVSYELGRQYWGNGFATLALQQFLQEINIRPLYARATKGNTRSIRVLRKCRFTIVGEDRFVSGNESEVEEFIFAIGDGIRWPVPMIRSAIAADAPQISSLLNQLSYTYLLSPVLPGAEAFLNTIGEPFIRGLVSRSDIDYVVAEDPIIKALAGAAGMTKNGVLHHLFVHPAYQRDGLGRRLWEFLRDRAIQGGYSGAFTVYSSVNAVPVYQRFGFAVFGTRIEKNGGVSVPMRCASPASNPRAK